MRSLYKAILLCAVLWATSASADPDRESLLEAWETYVASLPGTSSLEKTGDQTYRLADTDLPYEGELRIVGALIRPLDTGPYESDFSHVGLVEFELPDLPVERMSSQGFYYWQSDRQNLHYSTSADAWLDPTSYQDSITELYGGKLSFGGLSFMLNYGIWILLIGLLVFVFLAVARQGKKAQGLMDDSAAINQQARENLDRSEQMQDEVMEIAREARDLQAENNALLTKMLEVLERRP